MERISARRHKPLVVEKVVESLRQSIHHLALTNPDYMVKFLTSGNDNGSSSSSNATTTSTSLHYHHGSPIDAIHESLIDLFKPPFVSFCVVVIDGMEMVYANQAFERSFFTAEEGNRRIHVLGQAPTQDVFGR